MARVFIETLGMNANPNAKEDIKKAIKAGNTVVVPNTAIDMRVFQENPEWFEKKLKKGQILIQIFFQPDQMVAKDFHWSSMGITTPACESFEECLEKHIPAEHKESIQKVVDLMREYGLIKGEGWQPGEYEKPEPLSEEDAEALGVPVDATRTDVLAAAKETDKMDVFDHFNNAYNGGMARQHGCEFIMQSDGVLVSVKK